MWCWYLTTQCYGATCLQVRSIFVGGLPESVNEQKLQEVFKVFGEIEKIMLPYSKEDPTK